MAHHFRSIRPELVVTQLRLVRVDDDQISAKLVRRFQHAVIDRATQHMMLRVQSRHCDSCIELFRRGRFVFGFETLIYVRANNRHPTSRIRVTT